MENVLTFPERSEEGTYSAGEAICSNCKHEWVGVVPSEGQRNMECPECHTMHGHLKWPYGTSVGQYAFTCACGGEDFFIMRKTFASVAATYCRSCGIENTSWFT